MAEIKNAEIIQIRMWALAKSVELNHGFSYDAGKIVKDAQEFADYVSGKK